jgi:hypothetical protein
VDQFKFSDSLNDTWSKFGRVYKKKVMRMKRYFQTLLKTRNRLLKMLKDIHEFDYNTDIFLNMEKEDYLRTAELIAKLENTPYLDLHALWGIKKKDGSEINDDDELSESGQ